MPAADGPDRFRIVRRLDVGGMATVYLALDTEQGDAPVALKVPHPDLIAEPSYRVWFEQEAVVMRRLASPHIVRTIAVQADGPAPFMAMEYVDGGTLLDRLERDGRLPTLEALRLTEEIARGLDAAARQGVLHRDIKPRNVLLTAAGRAKLTDFGIAQAAGVLREGQRGAFLGTVQYVAPEVALGWADFRSDVYSAGILLYQMLSGRVPFDGEARDVLQAHASSAPPPLPRRVHPAAHRVVARCLRKDPVERYQHAQHLADDCALAAQHVVAENNPAVPRSARLDAGSLPGRPETSLNPSSLGTWRSPRAPADGARHGGRRESYGGLVIQWGTGRAAQHAVVSFLPTDTLVSIGRAEENAVRLPDPYVSRHHAQIAGRDGRHRIRDLGSRHGTFVGGVRIQDRVLRDGDVIVTGRTRLTYCAPGRPIVAEPGQRR